MQTALWLHGYGSTDALMRAALPRDPVYANAHRFVCAPDRCALSPGRRQWFKISYLSDYLIPQIVARADEVANNLDPADRSIWVGHSQGAMIAAHAALTGVARSRRALCVAALLPFADSVDICPGAHLTFLHGAEDRMVPLDVLRGQIETLITRGAACDLTILPGIDHPFEASLAASTLKTLESLMAETSHDRSC
jgi:predicted esterase